VNRFNNKVAIVTGGASGIGLATAHLIVAQGGQVMVGDVNAKGGTLAVQALGADRAAFSLCDVSRLEDIEALVQATVDRFGGVDILVNNAGTGSELCDSVDLAPETWRRVMAIDLDSVFFACRTVIPHLRKRGGGAIVNVASISGLGGDHGFNAYNAAKAAVVNYTRTLALDHARDNIRANAVCPGLVATRLTAFMDKTGILPQLTAAIPMQRIGQPEEIAQLIAFLASDEASYMTGSIVVADGGQTASNGNADLGKLLANLPPSVTSSAST
jgi:meso-butanediol dehydrogenase/(S,S)-butanediol dehydrogenase/diacetyl reductase